MNDELKHHGIKGQKWGVRRYQNKDGSLTNAGKMRNYDSDISTDDSVRNKRVVAVVVGTASVAAAAYYVHNHPESIGRVVSQFRNVRVSDLSKKAVDAGKAYVKESITGVKEGVKEASKEAPKKAAKAVVTGVVLNQTKRALDSAVGKEESARIFQANDNKKIGKFWKVSSEDKDDED